MSNQQSLVIALETVLLEHLQSKGFIQDKAFSSDNPPLQVRPLTYQPHFLVALSGGIDSVVMLHALCVWRPKFNYQLSAMYIHHGLSPNAGVWQDFCAKLCERLQVPFYFQQVEVDTKSGIGTEAAAREARYQALHSAREALNADSIVLAHHQHDQAETFLLQLMRGSGIKGLSSMAKADDTRHLFRPLLGLQKDDIIAYAKHAELTWVEDESNRDIHYDRNYIRQTILPVFEQRFPQARATMARSAQHMAEAQQLVDVLAAQDFKACGPKNVWMGQSISLLVLRDLGYARAKNVLRYWLAQQNILMPNADQLDEYWTQLTQVKPDNYLKLSLKSRHQNQAYYLHLYQGVLHCVKSLPKLPSEPLIWRGESDLKWGCWRVQFQVKKGEGIALTKLNARLNKTKRPVLVSLPDNIALKIHPRVGGEMLQPDTKRPHRELKTLFQMHNIPPWERIYHPLVSIVLNGHEESSAVSQPLLVAMLPDIVGSNWKAVKTAYGLTINLSPINFNQ